jgi:uncharacterized protein YcbK (DUF882 family)
MTPEQWQQLNHFKPGENWGDPARMDPGLMLELDRLRTYIGHPIIIHCGFETRNGKGYHPEGLAVDCHVEILSPLDFFLAAVRFNFSGFGIYPWWDKPGLHLDKRPTGGKYRALWGSTGPRQYVELNARFIRSIAGT